jgi:Icc-related predicted phosphoesterase
MKINLVSDMHLNFQDITMPGGDILIMAGDIMEAGHLRKADNARENTFLADRYRRFINEELVKYKRVIYVAGNHEHYSNSYDDTHDRLKRELPDHVHFLEAESVQIEDVHFFGGTFWTCMNKGDPISMNHLKQAMNDFSGAIKFGSGVKVNTLYGSSYYTNKFTPAYAKGIFHETVEKLKQFVEGLPNEKIVVVSHHAPSPQSVDEYYKHDYHMNAGYHSYLDDFIMDHPQIKAWVHGHMHDPVDYMIGTTRVLSNPRGYAGYETQANLFDPGFSFEV